MVKHAVKEVMFDSMRQEDLSEVLAIEAVSAAMPWTERLFLNEIDNPRSVTRVARIGARIAGFICASHVLDEGNIRNVAVHPDFRKEGIGSVLIRLMINLLEQQGCRSLYLEVRSSNEAAIRLYERAGFRMIGTRKRYYASPVEDAVIMSLQRAG